MSEKRKRDKAHEVTGHANDKKRQRKGFTVGPANLPDGVYKRKTQKIKQALIDKAKIKKEYAKLKKQGIVAGEEESLPQPASLAVQNDKADDEDVKISSAPHPDRQTLIEGVDGESEAEPHDGRERQPRAQKLKVAPFKKEYDQAQKRKQEAEERRKAREEAERERQRKIEERERFRKAMAKARTGGRNGQRKLGRESGVLLERVKRLVGESGR